MDKKKTIEKKIIKTRYTKSKKTIITKKIRRYKAQNLIIYTGRSSKLYTLTLKKNFIKEKNHIGVFVSTKKTGRLIHNTLKKKRKSNCLPCFCDFKSEKFRRKEQGVG